MSHFNSGSPFTGWEMGLSQIVGRPSFWDGSAWRALDTSLYNDGNPHGFILNADGGSFDFIVDDVEVTTGGTIGTVGDSTNSVNFGADSNASPGRYLSGDIAQLGTIKSVLSGEDLTNLRAYVKEQAGV